MMCTETIACLFSHSDNNMKIITHSVHKMQSFWMLNYVLYRHILISGINDCILPPSFFHSMDVLEVLSSLPLAIHGVISLSALSFDHDTTEMKAVFHYYAQLRATVPTGWVLSRCTVNSWAVSNFLNYFCKDNRSVFRSARSSFSKGDPWLIKYLLYIRVKVKHIFNPAF